MSATFIGMSHVQARTCWDRAIESGGGLENRRAEVAAFNEKSRFRKRGLAMTPTKFGISFTTKFLNQVGGRPSSMPERAAQVHWLYACLTCGTHDVRWQDSNTPPFAEYERSAAKTPGRRLILNLLSSFCQQSSEALLLGSPGRRVWRDAASRSLQHAFTAPQWIV